ncbi:MAG TPA: peptidyl-prolyl cis-trans isomerase [Verrucomicrobiae bacterium]|nr:peptidyl-prolyl cis-trans isomerase [Verrucomicrobiae bacterium]
MRMRWLLCVLFGTLAWGQGAPPPAQPGQTPGEMRPPAEAAAPDTSASVPPTAAVLTIEGICSTRPRTTAAKGTGAKPATSAKPAADCKTVITKAEFELLMKGAAPNANPQMKRQLASVLPRFIAMADAAKKKGLDKSRQFEELMKFVRMQVLSRELERTIQAEAADVPQTEIEAYYKGNPEAFEQFNLERLFVPRMKVDTELHDEQAKDEKLTPEQQKAKEDQDKAKQDAAEQAMTKLAEDLRARAAAGEDFEKLQKEAFDAAGMKISSPTVKLPGIRRTGLAASHAAVFDLKAGEVSQVISDAGGHYIYKLDSKTPMPLEQVKGEIHNTLQSQRFRDMMQTVNGSYHVVPNEAYFGPGELSTEPARMPPGRRPGGMMRPSQPQTPPSQPPAEAPATKPN